MATKTARQYEQISAKAYEHPADRAATSALHAVPLLDKVIKRLTDLGHERRFRQVLMGNAVLVSEHQLPATWALYQECLVTLDVTSAPQLYVINTPVANALTVGAHTPLVVVNSALVASYDQHEIQSVLAHETAHVLSEHYYYTTALVLLSEVMRGALPRSLVLGLPVRAMYLALLEWHRAAELSADRASALVMGDPLDPCRMLMRLAAGSLPGLSFDAFIAQAMAYEGEDDIFSRHSRFMVELNRTHPFAIRRVKELVNWVHAGDYDRIVAGQYPRRGQEPPPSADFNDAVAHYRERFARFIQRTAGDVQRLSQQFSDWLKAKIPDVDDDADEGAGADGFSDGFEGIR